MKRDNKNLVNLKKALGQLNKVIKMVENGEYCIDIIHQNMAVIGLLKSTNQIILERHLHSCFKNAMEANNEEVKEKMINEILQINKLSGK